MIRRFDKLPLAFLVCEVLFYGVGGLVVSDIELWFEPLVVERVENFFKASDDGRIRLIFDRDGKDVIGIIVIRDEVVLVAI